MKVCVIKTQRTIFDNYNEEVLDIIDLPSILTYHDILNPITAIYFEDIMRNNLQGSDISLNSDKYSFYHYYLNHFVFVPGRSL